MKKCKSLRIDEDVINRVEEIARKHNRSFNNMVEVILQGYASYSKESDSTPSIYNKESA